MASEARPIIQYIEGSGIHEYHEASAEVYLPLKAPHSVVIFEMVNLESIDRLSNVSSDPVNSIAWLRTSSLLHV